jgi:hypothetical protein
LIALSGNDCLNIFGHVSQINRQLAKQITLRSAAARAVLKGRPSLCALSEGSNAVVGQHTTTAARNN